VPFADWCEQQEEAVGDHNLTVLTSLAAGREVGRDATALCVPTHYASEERIADLLQRLGKMASAAFIKQKLPEGSRIRSGDLGEILATEYVAEKMTFTLPIKRLRWKDHREMAMRGDDVLAVRIPDDGNPLDFLKAESKSRAQLQTDVVASARTSLNADGGLPSPHALAFVADRLRELGQVELSNKIDDAQLADGILPDQVCHLLFVFTGNDPTNFLRTDLQQHAGTMEQFSVGLRIADHAQFIEDVYEKVIADGDNG
jgi:hypothetical protein